MDNMEIENALETHEYTTVESVCAAVLIILFYMSNCNKYFFNLKKTLGDKGTF